MFQMETFVTSLHAKLKQPDDISTIKKTTVIEPKVEININFNTEEEDIKKIDYINNNIKTEQMEIDEEVQKLVVVNTNVVSICVEPDINLDNRIKQEPYVTSKEFMVYVKQESVSEYNEISQNIITSDCDVVNKRHKRKTTSPPQPLRNWSQAPPYYKEIFTPLPDDYLNCYPQHNAQPSNDEMDTYTFNNNDHTYEEAELNSAPEEDTQKQIKTTFGCSYCNYRANDRSTLAKHINAKHTKITVFSCSYCNYKTYQKGHLKNHINGKHTKDSCFSCPYCAYTTYHKSNLNKHVNSRHTKVTQYSCSYCSYKAYRKGHLTQHVNAKHTESNVFNCSYKAYQKGNLSRHVEAKHANVNKNGD